MSCHDIGRGMNEVVRMIITQYDRECISRETATKLIATCRAAVYWCDGNEGEAVDYIRRCRCGKCLRMIPKGEKLISLWSLGYSFISKPGDGDIVDTLRLASDGLCETCFDNIITMFYSEIDLDELKERIILDLKPEEYLSEGEHQEKNNMLKWVRSTEWYD
ncbi:MAG: hypothetical protein K6G24_11315 [Lachnospiraceae bacterium]|nr:hypothetical protein [Lachnospiraceae bacterium]